MTSTTEGMPNVGRIDFGDGNNFVSVVPPLEFDETNSMQWAGILDPSLVIVKDEGKDPPESKISGPKSSPEEEGRVLTPEEKKEIATRIAYALSLLRKGSVELPDGAVITNPHINNLA